MSVRITIFICSLRITTLFYLFLSFLLCSSFNLFIFVFLQSCLRLPEGATLRITSFILSSSLLVLHLFCSSFVSFPSYLQNSSFNHSISLFPPSCLRLSADSKHQHASRLSFLIFASRSFSVSFLCLHSTPLPPEGYLYIPYIRLFPVARF